MKTDALFLDLEKRNNIYLYKETNSDIVNQFEEKYLKFKDKFFYEQFTNSGGIVKKAIEDSASNEVCAFGLNPNNGQPINDEAVGYIDANGNFCFPRENLNLSSSHFKRKEDDFER